MEHVDTLWVTRPALFAIISPIILGLALCFCFCGCASVCVCMRYIFDPFMEKAFGPWKKGIYCTIFVAPIVAAVFIYPIAYFTLNK